MMGFIALSLFLALLSMLSKEQGITVIGVCAAYDVLVHWNEVTKIIPIATSNGIVKEKRHFSDEFKAVLRRICKLVMYF